MSARKFNRKPTLAVVSQFLDKQHGTERVVTEQVERLADEFEIHVYSSRVKDLDLSKIVWHRLPGISSPLLVGYLLMLTTNHLFRWWDRRIRNLEYDMVYSPGINCLDARVIAVHIVFAEFHRQLRDQLGFSSNPIRHWPRLIHRRLLYRLFMFLESLFYRRADISLAAVSRKVAEDLARHYGRRENVTVVYNGVDTELFHPYTRVRLRAHARELLGLPEDAVALLLIGNDWKKKGLRTLLDAAQNLKDPHLWVLVAGRDDRAPYESILARPEMAPRVLFCPPRRDVEFYYAAADVYVGPSLEDAFALPPLEAMACGVPVIVSRRSGVSEIIRGGVDGLILEDPTDSRALANLICCLTETEGLRKRIGENAAATARRFSWDCNARQMSQLFFAALQAPRGSQDRSNETVHSLETRR